MEVLTPVDNASVSKSSLEKERHQKVFFPNLDALRFICFMMVFVFHSHKTIFENLKPSKGEAGSWFYSVTEFFFRNGELGVNFFFVLSGFLITFLLIKEKETTGTVHLRNFYIRRVLRIWPLFYLCILIGFVIVPLLKNVDGQESTEIARPIYYILLVNNFDYIQSWPSFPDALILIVLWSVAVEEQFYLTWPILLKFLSKKRYPVIFGLIILFTLVFRSFYTSSSDHDYAVRHFHTLAVIGDMALGGILAYYCSYQSAFLKYIINMRRWQIAFLYLGAVIIILFRHQLFENPFLIVPERIIIAFFFGFIILEQNFSKHSFFKFSQLKRTSKLGMYTYGLYCFHFFVISIVQTLWLRSGLPINELNAFIAAFVSLLLLVALCKLSFHYFERPFLKLKDRFAFISRN